MMNERTILFERDEDKRLFAEIIIEVIEAKQHRYEREHRELETDPVLLADISFGIVYALDRKSLSGIGDHHNNTGIPRLQEIAKRQGKPNEESLITAQRMFSVFCCIDEIKRYDYGGNICYKLRKEGQIYKHLEDKALRRPL